MFQAFPFHTLLQWYQKNGRHELPWRDYSFDAKTLGYRVWLAETMLQQTQVERVKSYFENILQTFPDIETLAKASYEDFFPYYKGLGYYSRARNMLTAAKIVSEDFKGIFPTETAELKKLPGVGPYTAEAIRAFTYNIPTLSFDTNLEKIFSRYYHGNRFQKLSKEEKQEILEQMKVFCNSYKNSHLNPLSCKEKGAAVSSSPGGEELRGGISRDINNALMDYGAILSLNTIVGIDWEHYPFPESKFYQTRGALEPIPEKKKSSFPTKDAYVLCILHENHKKYFSVSQSQNSHLNPLSCKKFVPFLIGKNTGNPRAMIQEYFRAHFGLELSVRPPEVKSYNKDEIPYLVCYAQIQSGQHNFQVFENMKVRGFEENLVEKMEF